MTQGQIDSPPPTVICLSSLWIPGKSSQSVKSHMPGRGDLSLASSPVQHDVTYKAAMAPAGVVKPIYDLGQAMLMNCTHPSLQPSIIHPSIISSDRHMWVHLPAYLWGWACRPKVLSAPRGSEQRSLHRRWRCRTGWLPLCGKRQKHGIYNTYSTANKPVRQRQKQVLVVF